MNRKLLFFDIDGTLMGANHFIPESTVIALKKAKEKGNLRFICSGRSAAMLPKKVLDLDFDGLICGAGTYVNLNGELLLDYSLSPEILKRILKWFVGVDFALIFEGKDAIYHLPLESYRNPDIIKFFMNLFSDRQKVITPTNLSEVSVSKFSGLVSPEQWDYAMRMAEDIKDVMSLIISKFPNPAEFNDIKTENRGDKLNTLYRFPGYGAIEFLPVGHNKYTGIKVVLDKLNISENDVYAFGDSANDFEMLSSLPNSICMGNGNEDIKKISSYITASLDEDGIYKAMEHFNLI